MEMSIHLFSKRGLLAIGAIITALLFVIPFILPRPLRAENERIVTIYHDGIEKTVVTDAPNVGEVLKRIGVELNEHDTVEPAPKTELTAPSYSINVYRARPVVVVDGVQRFTVMSPHTSARKIAESAGLKVYNEDGFTLTRINDFLHEDGVGLKLTIDRSTPLILALYGKKVAIRTQAETVGDLLQEKNVTLGLADGINVTSNTPIIPGMSIEVWRNGVQTITQEEDMAFAIEQIRDADKPVGFKEVREAGEPGKKMVTYEVELRNGHEISRTQIQSVVAKEPRTQVEVIGVKPKNGPVDPEANKALGHQMMLAAGFGEDQWPCLLNLWARESGWNQYSENRSSGAYGIPQALPGSKMGIGWESDPVVQINWGLGYITGRYSTPCGAWEFFLSRNWY